MDIFNKFGDVLLKLFSLIGAVVIGITHIPQKLRGIDTQEVKDNISNIRKDSGIEEKISSIDLSKMKSQISTQISRDSIEEDSKNSNPSKNINNPPGSPDSPANEITFPALDKFSSQEKEKTILKLQIISGAFIVVSILYIFNFFSWILFLLVGAAIVALTLYLLFKKVKLMYSEDFNAYRDFFLMYLAVGIVLVLVGDNPALATAFPFQFLPSLSVLLFAVICVAVVFLVFRIRYHRNYTYGQVIEPGKKTAYVRVDYDIRSNVKPDIYIVENNNFSVAENEWVKLQLEGGLLSMNGNKPVSILDKLHPSS
ncbi:MAG: DUF2101 family protein [Euryarchaeota archaeon]|nr:DUF2101 family protein [Euryarchaeota archaeon]MBU4608491.1 DUF2101 family protein [Euryarchaeota archaeon]MBV1729645.1 DUF2101 family protein [Methanobacterium sp.]MBV1755948.1 DUF2101 family protein [Methanobacterium sp.]